MSLNPDEIAMSALSPVAPFDVVKVVDTRDFIEIDDRFVPLPGSGEKRPCDRCDRLHEIHAHVIDATGHGFVVGTGCMDAAANAAARKAARRATTAAKTAAKREVAEARAARLAEFEAAAAALPFPADRVESGLREWTAEVTGIEVREFVWEVDGVKVRSGISSDGRPFNAEHERLACLEDNWRAHKVFEMIIADLDDPSDDPLAAARSARSKARAAVAWLERNPA